MNNDELDTEVSGSGVSCVFRVGPGLALIKSPTFVLVDPRNGEFAETLWNLIDSGAGLDELIEKLLSIGLRSLGDFAMAQLEGDDVRLVLRGNARASVLASGGDQTEVEAGEVKTWAESIHHDVKAFTLATDDIFRGLLPFRLGSGLVPADLIRWSREIDSILGLEGLDFKWVDDFEPPLVGGSDPAISTEVESEGHANEDADLAGRPALVVDEPAAISSLPPPSAAVAEPLPDKSTIEEPSPNEQPDEQSTEPVNTYDALYGRTIAKSVLDAVVEIAEVEAADPITAESEDSEPADVDAPPVQPDAAERPSGSSVEPSDLIQGVPPGAQSSGSHDATIIRKAVPESLGDHDGRTITADQLAALRESSGGTIEPPVIAANGPAIQSRVCQSGHSNPPHEQTCSHCGIRLEGPPSMIPRPSLGRMVFSSGHVLELDRPAIIGRNPKIEGSMTNEMPKLVRLDIGKGLSRSHAMVRLEGWQVLLEDLASSNGTFVTLPGRDARRLHTNEPVQLEPGSVIDFGGEVTASFESAH